MKDLKLKRLTILYLIFILLIGCTSQVDTITKKISEGFDTSLSDSLKTFSATISYYSYAVPTNYWYSEETTTKELIKDEFQYGDKKLQKLDEDISEIATNNDNINEAIQKLKLAIKKDRTQIKKSKEALQKVNFLFGLFGGAEGLVDFAALFGAKTDEDKIELPKNVKKAFLELNNQIEISQYGLLQKANEIELSCIGSEKLTPEQRKDVRASVIETLSNKIKQSYHGEDKETINRISSKLVEQYSNLYVLNELPSKGKEEKSDDETSSQTVQEIENGINEIVQRKYDKRMHVLTDAEADWDKYDFENFIKPERTKNKYYPYIVNDDFNDDGYEDIAAIVVNPAASNRRLIIIDGKTKEVEWWKEKISKAAIGLLPKQQLTEFNEGEKPEHKISMIANGIQVIYFETSAYVIYWDGSKYKQVWTSD